MNVVKTSMAERNLKKFTRSLAGKNQMIRLRTSQAQKLATRQMALMQPEVLLLEQKFFKAVDPEGYELLSKNAGAKEILENCRKMYNGSITAIARAFFSNPDIVSMRVNQEAIIGNNTKAMQECSGRLLNEYLAARKNG